MRHPIAPEEKSTGFALGEAVGNGIGFGVGVAEAVGGGLVIAGSVAGAGALSAGSEALAVGVVTAGVGVGALGVQQGTGIAQYSTKKALSGGDEPEDITKKSDWKRANEHQIETLKEKGFNAHDPQWKVGKSKQDVFIDKKGNVGLGPRKGSGEIDPLEINIYNE